MRTAGESGTGWAGDDGSGPTAPEDRIVSLDVLRGVAIFGILVINVQSFSMPSVTRRNPTQFGEFAGVEFFVWLLSHVLFEQKFIALFSIMFGAGIVLFMESKRAGDRPAMALHYRRTLVLLVIGVGHAYLLWHGDILVVYALCALWAVLFWTEEAWTLFVIGAALLAVPTVLAGGFVLETGLSNSHAGWTASEAAIQSEIDAYQGSWSDGLEQRIESAWRAHTTGFLTTTGWRYTGLILWGMAFYKWGLLTNDWSRAAYRRLLVGGGTVGLAFVGLGLWTVFAYDWAGGAGVLAWELNEIGALFMAPAYAAAVMLYCRRRTEGPIVSACAAVGRTALSNYLFQTVVATTIFYGYGFGLFGQVSRIEQLAVVVGIWLLQAVLSVLWLRRHRYGPVEWLWRRATYGSRS